MSSRQPGLGFPIMRFAMLFSLATGAVCGFANAPHEGKETGEPALLRSLLDRLNSRDILLGDACYCSYFMIALLMERGIDDHITVRELTIKIATPDSRASPVTLVATLTRHKKYPKSELGDLYRQRWNAELDIRSIKVTMNLEDLRGQFPDMVRKELWVHCLAYNLIRKTMAAALATHERQPRQISFAGALQTVSGAMTYASILDAMSLTTLATQKLASGHLGGLVGSAKPLTLSERDGRLHVSVQPASAATVVFQGAKP